MYKYPPDDFDYECPIRTACPVPQKSGYREVDCVRHKVNGWMLCEVYDTCPAAKQCDWSGQNLPVKLQITKHRLRMMRRAFGIFRDIDESVLAEATGFCLERCREVRVTARQEYERLRGGHE